MNCATVRDRLDGARARHRCPLASARAIDRHLAWCAACRKEAAELQSAAAVLRVRARARPNPTPRSRTRSSPRSTHAVGRRAAAQRAPRRGRLAVVAVLAAMLAVIGLGWGAVMAGRAARSDEAALRHDRSASRARSSGSPRILSTAEFGDAEGEVFLGTLGPSTERRRWRQRAHPGLALDHRHGHRARQRRAAGATRARAVHRAAPWPPTARHGRPAGSSELDDRRVRAP